MAGGTKTVTVIGAGPAGLVEEAGRLALALRAGGLSVTHKGPGLGQALTEADLAISRMMHAALGPRLIEEETAAALGRAEAARLLAEPGWTYIADPIDGTAPFAGGLPGWGMMVAACRDGRPEVGVLGLPAWVEARDDPEARPEPERQRGLLLAVWDGRAHWAPTLGGRRSAALRPLPKPVRRTGHVGWLANAARDYVLDFASGFFPWCESGAIADAALVATGRLDATAHNHKLWDLAAALPLFEAQGLALYRWPDLAPAPRAILDLFDGDFACRNDLWLVCETPDQARLLAAAVRRVSGPTAEAAQASMTVPSVDSVTPSLPMSDPS